MTHKTGKGPHQMVHQAYLDEMRERVDELTRERDDLARALYEARDSAMGYAAVAISSGDIDAEDCVDLAEYLRDQPTGHGYDALREQISNDIFADWGLNDEEAAPKCGQTADNAKSG